MLFAYLRTSCTSWKILHAHPKYALSLRCGFLCIQLRTYCVFSNTSTLFEMLWVKCFYKKEFECFRPFILLSTWYTAALIATVDCLMHMWLVLEKRNLFQDYIEGYAFIVIRYLNLISVISILRWCSL